MQITLYHFPPSLCSQKVRLALVYSDRALRWVPEDRRATELRDGAAARLIAMRESQRRSIEIGSGDPFHGQPEAVRELAVALLLPEGDPSRAAGRLRDADPNGPLADESLFVDAMLLGEAGETTEMWRHLERLAELDGDTSNMQRHAEMLFNDPNRNTWQAFADARAQGRWNRFKWVLLGPFSDGIPDRGLPGPLEWIFDAPALAEHIGGAPMRLINLPWAKALPSARVTATAARSLPLPHSEYLRERRPACIRSVSRLRRKQRARVGKLTAK